METRTWQFDSLGGPEGLRPVDQTLPDPAPGQALVRIRTIGLNRSDLAYMAGRYIKQPPSPSFLGQEAVGEVVALGDTGNPGSSASEEPAPGVDGFRPRVGDRVGLLVGRVDFAGMGTFRRHGLYPVDALLPCPPSLDDAEAAGLWVAGLTAAGGLRAGGLTPETGAGRTVLITAASSGVGLVAVQLAKAWGATVLATTTSAEEVVDLVPSADAVLHTPDADRLEALVMETTDGHGVDLAFDPVGFEYAPALFRTAATDGHVVCYGIMAGAPPIFDLVSLLRKDVGVHGFTIYRLLRRPGLLDTVVGDVLSAVRAGALRPRVAGTYPFDEAPAALAAMATNRHVGKIVVACGDN